MAISERASSMSSASCCPFIGHPRTLNGLRIIDDVLGVSPSDSVNG